MPKPRKGEKEKDFISRCIPMVIEEGTAKDQKQAAAVCYSMWRDAKGIKDVRNSIQYKNTVLLQATTDEADAGTIQGTVFYKQLVAYGKWVNPLFPVEYMDLDEEFGKSLKKNFDSGIVGKVPIPLDHTDQVDRNAGELIKVELKPDGVYGYLDIRREEVVEDIMGGLIFDVSIHFDWNYIDTKTGDEYGPTLLHVALVNNPYLKGMTPFDEFFGALNNKLIKGLALSTKSNAIMLSESKVKELQSMETATVKNDKEYAVTIKVKNEDGDEVEKTLEPGEETEVPKDQSEDVMTQITDAEEPENTEDEEEEEPETPPAGGNENETKLSEAERKELAKLRKTQAKYETEQAFSKLQEKGKITPAQKDAFMKLAHFHGQTVKLSDKQVTLSKIVTDILLAGPKVVKFSEDGSSKDGEGTKPKSDEKPSTKLSEGEQKGMQAVGADPKRMDELAEKHPAMQSALENMDKKE